MTEGTDGENSSVHTYDGWRRTQNGTAVTSVSSQDNSQTRTVESADAAAKG